MSVGCTLECYPDPKSMEKHALHDRNRPVQITKRTHCKSGHSKRVRCQLGKFTGATENEIDLVINSDNIICFSDSVSPASGNAKN